MPSRLA
ncbi:hypothetical protein AKJ16_DCAP08369 [Drosera capensis]